MYIYILCIFSPPSDIFDTTLTKILSDFNYTYTFGYTLDLNATSPSDIMNNFKSLQQSKPQNSFILRMNSGNKFSSEALVSLLDYIKTDGFEIISMEKCINKSPYAPDYLYDTFMDYGLDFALDRYQPMSFLPAGVSNSAIENGINTPAPVIKPVVVNPVYIGCYMDSFILRDLDGLDVTFSSNVDKCAQLASKNGEY